MSEKIHKNLKELFEQFELSGNKTAIIAFSANQKQHISFEELALLIQNLSAGLLKSGLKPQDRVMFLANNSPELIVAILSIIYTGGVCVPVDMQSTNEVLDHIAKDSAAKRIFVDRKGLERWRHLTPHKDIEIIQLSNDDKSGDWQKLFLEESEKGTKPQSRDLAVLFYTSGTTGLPKGVPLTHANIMTQIEAVMKTRLINESDSVLLPLPLFHVYPFVIGLLVPFSLSIPVILPKSITGPEIIRAIKEGGATVLIAVPRLIRALYAAIETKAKSNNISRNQFYAASAISNFLCQYLNLNIGKLLFAKLHKRFPKLRLLASGGALLEPDLAAKLIALGWRIAVGYGLTETSPLLTIRMPNNRDLKGVGKPVPGVQIRLTEVANTDEDQEKQKEIQAKGANIFSGYNNLPEKTAETFTEDGWFRTGDIGHFSYGNLHVTGRISTMIKSEGGKKIQPDEIEKSYEGDPVIREIGVLEYKQKLVALVVPNLKSVGHKNIQDAVGEIIKKKSAQMPSYDRITDFAVSKDLLPRTNLGKIRRHELTERYEKAKAETKNGTTTDSKAEISDDDKTLLENPAAKNCWEWLHERFPDTKLTLDKSPQIDLNIDSLEWINLTLEIRQQVGVELTEEAIARVDTVRDLLKEVADAAEAGIEAISPFDQPEHFIDEDLKGWLEPLNPFMLLLSRILCWSNQLIMAICFRISSKGLENIPKGQVIFTPNHASYLDAFALSAVLGFNRLHKSQWAGWAGIALANPFNAFIYRLVQAVPIEANKSLISSLALATAVLKNHKNFIWFPEGERTLTGRILPFKAGIGMLLEHFSLPVIPVFLDGTREALPPGAFWPNFNKITVIFGQPVMRDELVKEGEGNNNAERIANALHERVRKLRPRK